MDLPALLCSVLLSSRPVMLHTYPSFPFLLSAASATSFSAPLCTTTHHFAHLWTTFHPFPPLCTLLRCFASLCTPLHCFAPLCTALHPFALFCTTLSSLCTCAPHQLFAGWQNTAHFVPPLLCPHIRTSFCTTSALSALIGGCATVQCYLQLAAVPEASCFADA